MANKASKARPAGLTPAKAILIGVLAVVLIAVVCIQFRRSDVAGPSAAAGPPVGQEPTTGQSKAQPKERGAAEPVEAANVKPSTRANWQAPEVASIVQYDPLARPASFPQPVSAALERELAQANSEAAKDNSADPAAREAELQQMRAQLEELRHRGVQVIIKQRDQFVAMIGDQTIHVGDEISGFKVVGIDGDGVHVARDVKQ